MSVRRSSIVFGSIGVVLLAAGIVLRVVLVPILTKLPSDTKLHIAYSGTGTLLNSKALAAGDTKDAIATGVPVTVARTVKVTSTHGDTAIVADDFTISAGGQQLANDHTYALDRTTLKGVKAPSGIAVEPSVGALSSAFPIGPKANNSYKFYDATTQAIEPVSYTGRGKIDGRSVNEYAVSISGPVKDAALMKQLPPALPKKLLAGLAALLPAAVAARLTQATLAALPDPVPLSYTGVTRITADIDRQTGIAINQHINQQVVAGLSVGGESVSLLPVLAFDFSITPHSQKYLADKAKSTGQQLTLLKVVLPIALVLVGLVLVVVAVLRRHRPAAAEPELAGAAT